MYNTILSDANFFMASGAVLVVILRLHDSVKSEANNKLCERIRE